MEKSLKCRRMERLGVEKMTFWSPVIHGSELGQLVSAAEIAECSVKREMMKRSQMSLCRG